MLTIAPGLDYPIGAAIPGQSNPTVAAIPATGLSGVQIFLADHPSGAAIDTALLLTAVESRATPGTYVATFASTDLTAFLTGRMGRVVYLRVQVGTHLNTAVPMRVVQAVYGLVPTTPVLLVTRPILWYALPTAAAQFAETGDAAELLDAHALPVSSGTFVERGEVATFGDDLVASPGTFTETANPATLEAAHEIFAAPGTFVETGTPTSGDVAMSAAPGAFADTGDDAALTEQHQLPVGTGAFVETGVPDAFTVGMPGSSGIFAETGIAASPGVGMPAAVGAFSETGNAATLTDSGGSDGPALSGLAVVSDDYTSYANTAALQANITTNIGGTGAGTVKYMDGANPTWASIDPTVTFRGHQTAKYIFPASTGGACELAAPLPSPLLHMWFQGSIKFKPTFNSGGTNLGSSGGYKILSWAFGGGTPIVDGSGRLEAAGGSGGTGADHYDFYWVYSVRSTGDQGGGTHITPPESLPTDWSDGDWINYYIEVDHTAGTSGFAKLWIGVNGGTPVYQGICTGAPSIDGESLPPVNYMWIGLNFNQTRDVGQDLQLNWGEWEVVDGSVHAHPFGL